MIKRGDIAETIADQDMGHGKNIGYGDWAKYGESIWERMI